MAPGIQGESLGEVIGKERDVLDRHVSPAGFQPGAATAAAEVPEMQAKRAPIGLALSGGGIRSATFCLGVLQALAKSNRLASFDYLSTVSGGGYIGSWLSAWIRRAGMAEVQEKLGSSAPAQAAGGFAEEAPEVSWLRRYSNYLTPRVGIFSLDSLTIIATWVRNFSLNLIILLSFLSIVFLLPLLLCRPLHLAVDHRRGAGIIAVAFTFVALVSILWNLTHQTEPKEDRYPWMTSPSGVFFTVVLPVVLASAAASVWLLDGPALGWQLAIGVLVDIVTMFVLLGLIWAVLAWMNKPKLGTITKEALIHALAIVTALLVAGVLVAATLVAWNWYFDSVVPKTELADVESGIRSALIVCVGLPLVLTLFSVATSIYIGIAGRMLLERSREWWSRLNSWLMAIGTGWLTISLLAFLSLPTLCWLLLQIGVWMSLVGTGWVGSLLTALFVRKPHAASEKVQVRFDSVLNVAALIFVLGLLVLVSAGTSAVLLRVGTPAPPPGAINTAPPTAAVKPDVAFSLKTQGDRVDYQVSVKQPKKKEYRAFVEEHFRALKMLPSKGALTIPIAMFLGVASFVLVLFSWRVDVNKFSLHNMYKNRLVRCYLGAINQKLRSAQPFTGLDDQDDFPLHEMAQQKPIHIINSALNLSQGANLAWQERKAASFVFTPVSSGFELAQTQGDSTCIVDTWQPGQEPGFRDTESYASGNNDDRGFTLGMALATSGAAVSPNMGQATRPAHAFVLTLFNVRLGRWSPNPARRKKWRHSSPRFGLICLLQELFGYSNERRNFVYLSDGGHFDNTGIYELVRRRCEVILAVDCGQDTKRQFRDIGNAVRKCRIDFQVNIKFDDMEKLRGNRKMLAEQGFATATIHYDPAGKTPDGKLIVIKPTLGTARKEPIDVLNYASLDDTFPQQTTADQFFDESQFESYRQLGLCIGSDCLAEHAKDLPEVTPKGPIPAKAPAATNAVPAPTRLIGWLRGRAENRLPPRWRSQVDTFLVGLGISVLAFVGLAAYKLIHLSGSEGSLCFSVERCAAVAGSLLISVDRNLPTIGAPFIGLYNPLYWWAQLDNVFILVYAFTFNVGFLVATGRVARKWVRYSARGVLWFLVGATAIVDFIENFLILSYLNGPHPVDSAAQGIAFFTALKFWLFSACLLALAFSSWCILQKFRKRWSVSGRDGTVAPPPQRHRTTKPPRKRSYHIYIALAVSVVVFAIWAFARVAVCWGEYGWIGAITCHSHWGITVALLIALYGFGSYVRDLAFTEREKSEVALGHTRAAVRGYWRLTGPEFWHTTVATLLLLVLWIAYLGMVMFSRVRF